MAEKERERMKDEEIQTFVRNGLADCKTYAEQLSVERTEATKDYHGDKLGNEEEGRSQVVVTEVRDAVLGVLPSLMRVLLGADRPVEYVGTKPEDAAAADQATEYARVIFSEKNAGFRNTMAVLKDGLVRRIGIFKWWHDPSGAMQAFRMEKLTEEQLQGLQTDPDVTIQRIERAEGSPFLTVELTKKFSEGRIRIDAVPPDEFIFNREARSVEDATIIGHLRELTRGELVDMGIDEDFLDKHCKGSTAEPPSTEAIERSPTQDGLRDQPAGEANDKIDYFEGFMRLDVDGDDVAELRRICAVGPDFTIVPGSNVPWDHVQFSVFSPDPEPHSLVGRSWRDRLKDIQRIKSAILRGTLDSMSLSMYPRMSYEDGYVSVADLLSTAIGAPIRVSKAGAIQEIKHSFVGGDTLPLMQFFDDLTERRIGRNNGVAGLDADALQSTDKQAVQAAIQGSQEQAELIARIFCDQALKPLFKGLLILLTKHRPRAEMVRLRGQWVELKPDAWNVDFDVRVNMALGQGFTERKIQTLLGVYAQQKELLATYGPSNGIVTMGMARNTAAKILELQGIMDVDNYFKPIDPDYEPPPAPPQPTPEQILADAQVQIEKMKTVGELARKKDELMFKETEARLKYELEVRKMVTAARVALESAALKAGTTVNVAKIESDIEREFREAELALQAHGQLFDQAATVQGQAHDQATTEADMAHSQAMDLAANDREDAAAAAPEAE